MISSTYDRRENNAQNDTKPPLSLSLFVFWLRNEIYLMMTMMMKRVQWIDVFRTATWIICCVIGGYCLLFWFAQTQNIYLYAKATISSRHVTHSHSSKKQNEIFKRTEYISNLFSVHYRRSIWYWFNRLQMLNQLQLFTIESIYECWFLCVLGIFGALYVRRGATLCLLFFPSVLFFHQFINSTRWTIHPKWFLFLSFVRWKHYSFQMSFSFRFIHSIRHLYIFMCDDRVYQYFVVYIRLIDSIRDMCDVVASF